MKAVLCKEFGPPEKLVLEEMPTPQPKPGEVLLEVHACGVNFPDVLMIQDKYQFKPPLPFSPGGEVSGVVEGFRLPGSGEHYRQVARIDVPVVTQQR